jgi:hypothetical protein
MARYENNYEGTARDNFLSAESEFDTIIDMLYGYKTLNEQELDDSIRSVIKLLRFNIELPPCDLEIVSKDAFEEMKHGGVACIA